MAFLCCQDVSLFFLAFPVESSPSGPPWWHNHFKLLSKLSDPVSGDTCGSHLVEFSQDFGSRTAVQLLSFYFQSCLLFFWKPLSPPAPCATAEFHLPCAQLVSKGIVLGWQFYTNRINTNQISPRDKQSKINVSSPVTLFWEGCSVRESIILLLLTDMSISQMVINDC